MEQSSVFFNMPLFQVVQRQMTSVFLTLQAFFNVLVLFFGSMAVVGLQTLFFSKDKLIVLSEQMKTENRRVLLEPQLVETQFLRTCISMHILIAHIIKRTLHVSSVIRFRGKSKISKCRFFHSNINFIYSPRRVIPQICISGQQPEYIRSLTLLKSLYFCTKRFK